MCADTWYVINVSCLHIYRVHAVKLFPTPHTPPDTPATFTLHNLNYNKGTF